MTRNIDVDFGLCDHLNPGCGYQIRVVDADTGVTLLDTSRRPDTGADLLTPSDCLAVAAMYL